MMAIQTLLPYDLNERNAASRTAYDLSTGLEGLLNDKVQKMQQKQQQMNQAQAFAAAGIPKEQAMLLSQADPQTQQLILKNYLQGAEGSGLDQALSQLSGSPMQQGQQQMQQSMGALQGQPQDMIMQNLMRGLGGQQQPQMQPQMMQQAMQQPGSTQAKANDLASVLQRPRLNPQQRIKIEEMKQRRDLAEKKLNAAERALVNKETLPVYEKTNDMAKGARESNMRLDRIETLLNKGNVQDNAFVRGLDALSHNKYLGDAFSAVKTLVSNRDTQEFEKLSKDFLRDAKQFFGNRVTQGEIFTFLQTVPSISQTNEGKKRVIRNMRIFNEAANLRKSAMDSIIKENKGQRPANLESLIDERIGSQLDALSNQFKDGPTLGKGFNLRQY
jgi:hypothetical protein